jgi:hypothetical protein
MTKEVTMKEQPPGFFKQHKTKILAGAVVVLLLSNRHLRHKNMVLLARLNEANKIAEASAAQVAEAQKLFDRALESKPLFDYFFGPHSG